MQPSFQSAAVLCLLPLLAPGLAQGQDTVESIQKELDRAHQERTLDVDVGRRLLSRTVDVAQAARQDAEQYAAWRLALDVIGKAGLRDDEFQAQKRLALEGVCKLGRDDAEKLVPLVVANLVEERHADLRAELLEETRSGSVKGACLYAEGMAVVNAMRGGNPSDAERQSAIAAMKRARDEFGKEQDYGRSGDWATAVEGPLFQLQNLYIGALAPDIEGEDLNGVEFKLSDYRGKVVLLDFWGHW
jgi:hypothetical protein